MFYIYIYNTGSCCWNMTTLPYHSGQWKIFKEGKFTAPTDMGVFYRQVGSVEKLQECPP